MSAIDKEKEEEKYNLLYYTAKHSQSFKKSQYLSIYEDIKKYYNKLINNYFSEEDEPLYFNPISFFYRFNFGEPSVESRKRSTAKLIQIYLALEYINIVLNRDLSHYKQVYY
ncbi:MAG: hypothetical protein M1458_03610 [Deltaproteobacteria bacterium]|nr:hypothetical protein [Deltaproteobacteria bacterium]